MSNSDFKDKRFEFEEKAISDELLRQSLVDSIKAGYKKKFYSDDNCIIEFEGDDNIPTVYQRKTVVADDDVYDKVTEISLSDAQSISDEAEIGDELDEEVDLLSFDRVSIMNGKQKFKQNIREIQKNCLYSEFKSKEKEIVIGYVQNVDARSGDCYIDLGNRTTGVLPKSLQNPLENYKKDDKLYVFIEDVKQRDKGVDIILSRINNSFVKGLLAIFVPEVEEGVIAVYKVARKPGQKTKIAVYSNDSSLDCVGTCIGPKGSRIQNLVREFNGEKIDIVEYVENPIEQFIANALTPATIKLVRITNFEARTAICVCENKELSHAIGRDGINVQLANRLTDWQVEILSEAEYAKLKFEDDAEVEENSEEDNISESIEAEEATETEEQEENLEEEEEDLLFDDLPFSPTILEKIKAKGITTVQEFANLDDIDIRDYFGFSQEEEEEFNRILNDCVELVEEN